MAHLIDYSGGYPGAAAVKAAGFDGAVRCSVEGCDRGVSARNLCSGHYQRFKKFGNVMSDKPITRVRKRGLSIIEILDDSFDYDKDRGCYIWNKSLDDKGYSQVKINGKIKKAYRVAYEEINGKLEKGLVVRHICDIRACINPFHLISGTVKDNVLDMHRRGRACVGDKSSWSKLNEAQVRELRLEFKNTDTSVSEMSVKYGINYRTLNDVLKYNTWKHVI